MAHDGDPTLHRLMRHVPGSFVRLLRDDRGTIALMFAFLAVPLILAAGIGIDLTFSLYSRQALQQLADEISTITASSARSYLSTNGVSQIAGAKTAAAAQTASLCTDFASRNTQLSSVQCTASVSLQGLTVGSVASVSASYNTFFMKIAGPSQIAYSEASTAQVSLPPYIDFYMLLDNSPSMGIGATVADMTNLANSTGGCEFACHDTGEPSSNTYQTARNIGVTLRIDQVKTAAQSLLTYAGSQTNASLYRVAAYSFGVEAYPGIIGLTQVAALNSNLTTVQNNLSSLDLMWLPYNNTNNNDDSDIDGNLTALANLIPTPGDGSSNANAKRVIYLVTDGAADIAPPYPGNNRNYGKHDGVYPGSTSNPCITTYNDYDGNHCMQPVTVSVCNAIKAKNILIAVLYTTYFKYSNSSEYPTYIQPIASAIPTNLQACASPGLYFEVNPQTTGINQAMQALFLAAVNQATRLTQ